MKLWKRFASIAIVAVLVLSVTSCSQQKNKTASSGKFNKEKVYALQGGLPDPAKFIANQNSEVGTSTFGDIAFEGLIRYQRATDNMDLHLADCAPISNGVMGSLLPARMYGGFIRFVTIRLSII